MAAALAEAQGLGASVILDHPMVVRAHATTEARAMTRAKEEYGSFALLYKTVLAEIGCKEIGLEGKPGDIVMYYGKLEAANMIWQSSDIDVMPAFISTTYERLIWTPTGLRALTSIDDDEEVLSWVDQ